MRRLARLLRQPRVIVGEIAALAAFFAVSTLGPLLGESGSGLLDAAEREAASGWSTALRALGLESPFTSPWFLLFLALPTASLSLVLIDQVGRAWRLSRRGGSVGASGPAPYRREAHFPGVALPDGSKTEVHTTGALGIWGSPLFHLGLLIIIVAGVLRLLFGAEAVVDLMVGETLASRSREYGVQWPGILARPFAFPQELRLEELRVSRYPSGATEWIEGTVRLGGTPPFVTRSIAINDPLRVGIHYLYIGSVGGTAALIEVSGRERTERHAILLRAAGGGARGEIALPNGTILRASTDRSGIGRVPEGIELRAVRGSVLSGLARLGRGEEVTLPEGTRVRLLDLLPWVELSGRRDISTPVVYLGFFFACLGGLLMVAVIRVERVVIREAVPDGARLTVLMRPQRFAPLFAEKFELLWSRSVAGLAPSMKDSGDART